MLTNNTIQNIRTNYPKLSLKAICEQANLCYQYVLKASKQPIAGKAYDPNEVNWNAVDAIVARKGVDLTSIDWQALEDAVKVVTPINKPEDFVAGTEFTLREASDDKKGRVYSILVTTATHLVFMACDSTQPRVMNWDTFEHQSPRIVNTKKKKEGEQA